MNICSPEAIEVPDSQKYISLPTKDRGMSPGCWAHAMTVPPVYIVVVGFGAIPHHLHNCNHTCNYNGNNLSSDVSSHTHTTTLECKRCTREKYILDL